jgi:N-acetyl-anhydromuramyl-L-alanine amidase AmpD
MSEVKKTGLDEPIQINGVTIPLEASPNYSMRPEDTTPSLIVLHSTGASYESAYNWLRNPDSRVSAHFLIGRDGTIVQLVPLEKTAWHAGVSSWKGKQQGNTVNPFSIGIELEHIDKESGGDWPEAQIQAVTTLVNELRKRYDISADNVVGHRDVAPKRKVDPDPAFPWQQIRREVTPISPQPLSKSAATQLPSNNPLPVLLQNPVLEALNKIFQPFIVIPPPWREVPRTYPSAKPTQNENKRR